MSVDFLAEAKRYDEDCNEDVIEAIKKHLGIALRSKDGAIVACSSKSERERVRESWMKKKLGLTDDDASLDAAIEEVCEKMKADKRKQRVTFYYLLAKNAKKLDVLTG